MYCTIYDDSSSARTNRSTSESESLITTASTSSSIISSSTSNQTMALYPPILIPTELSSFNLGNAIKLTIPGPSSTTAITHLSAPIEQNIQSKQIMTINYNQPRRTESKQSPVNNIVSINDNSEKFSIFATDASVAALSTASNIATTSLPQRICTSADPPPLAFFPKNCKRSQKPIIFSATEPPPLVPIQKFVN